MRRRRHRSRFVTPEMLQRIVLEAHKAEQDHKRVLASQTCFVQEIHTQEILTAVRVPVSDIPEYAVKDLPEDCPWCWQLTYSDGSPSWCSQEYFNKNFVSVPE